MGRPPFAISCESTVIPKSRQTRKKQGAQKTRGRDRRRSTKGRWSCTLPMVAHRGHRGKGRAQREKTRPTACRRAHSSSVFFFVCCCCCPALPVMRIIPASAGWQAQHGLCSGSGSGISTRAKGALSRPRRRGRPFRQHLVRPGCRRGTVVSCRKGRGAATPVDMGGGGCFN